MAEKKDFFISYNSIDKDYAEWIAWELEKDEYSTILQAWDFRPGNDFIIAMQKGSISADHTIAVLSENYLKAVYTQPEWAAAFADDPTGEKRKLIGVRVRECQPEGMLKSRIYIDITNISDPDIAKDKLLSGIKGERAKPLHPPHYPGEKVVKKEPNFPGKQLHDTSEVKAAKYMPQIPQEKTELAVNDYMSDAFNTIKAYFEDGCKQLSSTAEDVDVRIKSITEYKFIAEIYIGGRQKAICKIWLSRESYSKFSQIGYSEGHISTEQDNSYNEILHISDNRYKLSLKATMHFAAFGNKLPFDYDDLKPEQGAEYLWRRFIAPLEH